MSAYKPPTTAIGLDAIMPHISRKTSKTGQFGARAQAIVKRVKTRKLEIIIILLPYVSLKGPKKTGART